MNYLGEIYQGKTVLVTGHTGFKGSWLVIWLNLLGAKVIGYALEPPSNPNNFEASGLLDIVIHIQGDVKDKDHLLSVLDKYRPDFVFHLAAQPLVRVSYKEPWLTYETNVMGTVAILEAVRATDSVRVVINVTSDKCYENREWIWGYREDEAMGGYDPYSSSKGCSELITAAYQRSYFCPKYYGEHGVGLASVRAGNIIGGGDWGKDRLLPDCIRALSQGESILIRNPNAIRPWQHVLEPLYGYLLLGVKLWESGPDFVGGWNFGPMDGHIWNVERLVSKVCDLWGEGKYLVDNRPHPHEANWLKLDCSKAWLYLNWRSKYSVDQALKKTMEWYKFFYSGVGPKKLKEFTLAQIKEFQKK